MTTITFDPWQNCQGAYITGLSQRHWWRGRMTGNQQNQGQVDQGHKDQWHLDKRVPIALIFAILAQTIAGVWWAATLQGTVNELSRRQLIMETQANGDGVEAKAFSERLARMEERAAAQSEALRRIEAQISVIVEGNRIRPRDGYPNFLPQGQ